MTDLFTADLHPDEGSPLAPPPPPHPDTTVDRILDAICWVCMLVAGVALVLIVATFGWLVWGRYVMNATPTWVEQSALLLIAYVCFLGAAVGVRRKSHLSIDFVREAFPAVPREVMRHLADLAVMFFGACMAWQGVLLVMRNTTRMIPLINLPESWRFASMAIAGVLFFVFAGWNIVTRLKNPMRESA